MPAYRQLWKIGLKFQTEVIQIIRFQIAGCFSHIFVTIKNITKYRCTCILDLISKLKFTIGHQPGGPEEPVEPCSTPQLNHRTLENHIRAVKPTQMIRATMAEIIENRQ